MVLHGANITNMKQVRLDDDVQKLLAKYARQFPIKSTTPKQVNGLLRDLLREKVPTKGK